MLERHNFPWKDSYGDLWKDWQSLSKDRKNEVRKIKDKTRKISEVIKAYCRAMSVLLGGHFTTEQNWTFCCFDFELHYLLYARPPIFPGSRVQREVEDYVETQSSKLGWSTRYNMLEIVVDLTTGNPYQVLDPKFHPKNNGVTTLVGVGGDCVNLVRNKYSECRKVWQKRTNVAHPLDADGDLFASKVCDLYIDWWQHCIR